MINRIAFQNRLRTYNLFKEPNASQMQGMNAILDEWESKPSLYLDKRWLAYMLATAYHETAKTMWPIEEFGKGSGRLYGHKIKQSKEPYETPDRLYYGRGFVQLTWYENYEKFGKKLKIDLLEVPTLALSLPISTKIMFIGMTQGLFTGVNLARYFNDQREDWVSARKIINGIDKAELIGNYGKKFLNCVI
jgi:hypothetical protein